MNYTQAKRARGRPKGSTNKTKDEIQKDLQTSNLNV